MTSWMDLIRARSNRPIGWHLERWARIAVALHLKSSTDARTSESASTDARSPVSAAGKEESR